MKNGKKKVLLCALIFVVIAGAMYARGGREAGGRTTIRFSFDMGVGPVTQQIVDQFNRSQNEIFVETVILPQDANIVRNNFVNILASGDTSVDVMALDVVFIAEFAAAGWLQDLGPYFDRARIDEFLPGTIAGATFQDRLWAFPWFTNSSVLFYRKDVLAEIGADVPTTYAGWKALADRARGVGGVQYLASFQAAQSEALVTNWVEFIWNNGGEILNAAGEPVINSPNNIAATYIMLDMVRNFAPAGVTTYREPESEVIFLEGRSLFIRAWSGFWARANREGSRVAGNVGTTVLPIGPNGTSSHSCLGGLSLVVNRHISPTQRAAAIKFLHHMTAFETLKEFTLISGQPPVLRAVYRDPDVIRQIPFYAYFYNIIADARPRPVSPQYARLSDAIQRNIHQALTGTISVESALNNLQNEALALR